MTEKQFKQRIEKKQFDKEDVDEGYEREWWKSRGQEIFEEVGFMLISKGFTQEQALNILGMCYGAVQEEYGE